MSFSLSEDNTPAPVAVEITDAEVVVRLADGRTIATPLVWYPPLLAASPEQRRNVVLGPSGIHWPDLDEDLSVAGMLAGVIPTYKWLNHKARTAGLLDFINARPNRFWLGVVDRSCVRLIDKI